MLVNTDKSNIRPERNELVDHNLKIIKLFFRLLSLFFYKLSTAESKKT